MSSAGITDATGNALDGDNDLLIGGNANFNFFWLAGDMNHDRKVDVVDLGILSSHWQTTTGNTYATGDLNYDGKVDVVDLGILSSNWQKTLAAPAGIVADSLSLPAGTISQQVLN